MKNVMRMSQILTRIECLIGKKENLIKNLNTYTKTSTAFLQICWIYGK